MNTAIKNNNGSEVTSPHWELGRIVEDLRQVRERWRRAQLRNRECGGREFPARQRLREIVQLLCAAL